MLDHRPVVPVLLEADVEHAPVVVLARGVRSGLAVDDPADAHQVPGGGRRLHRQASRWAGAVRRPWILRSDGAVPRRVVSWPGRRAGARRAPGGPCAMIGAMTSVVIVGGGPGGYEAALVAAQMGAEVTLVDSDGIGGSAVLTDCVPSKALLAVAESATQVRGEPRRWGSPVPPGGRRRGPRRGERAHPRRSRRRRARTPPSGACAPGSGCWPGAGRLDGPGCRGGRAGLRGQRADRGRRDPAGHRAPGPGSWTPPSPTASGS